MNFDFSDDQKQLRDQARRFLAEKCTSKAVRQVLEGKDTYDRALWKGLAELGLLGVAIPEEFGGSGAGHLELCVIAEELGRVVAPVPVASSIYLAAEAIMLAGSDAQKRKYLPGLASGETIGTLALFEGKGKLSPAAIKASVANGAVSGTKTPVPDGEIADFAIVVARSRQQRPRSRRRALYRRPEGQGRRARGRCRASTRPATRPRSSSTARRPSCSARADEGWSNLTRVLDRAAVLIAFEQVGGAERALEMGRDYALDRMAFGRPIGSFQAIKHMLADMYVSATLARSNAYYARLGALDRRVGAGGSGRRRARQRDAGVPALLEAEHPGAWRHGLHLGVRLPPLLPALQRARARSRQHLLLGRPADRPHAHPQHRSRLRARIETMNFDDTPQEATFRTEVRGWIARTRRRSWRPS